MWFSVTNPGGKVFWNSNFCDGYLCCRLTMFSFFSLAASTSRGYTGFAFPATPRLQTNQRSWFAVVGADDLTWMTDSQVRAIFADTSSKLYAISND
jgi:hypothetical protein